MKCKHCGKPIEFYKPTGEWFHLNGRRACLPSPITYAEPESEPKEEV